MNIHGTSQTQQSIKFWIEYQHFMLFGLHIYVADVNILLEKT